MNYNYNYAKIENDNLSFAPMCMDQAINSHDIYINSGYKKTYGGAPIQPSLNSYVFTILQEFDNSIVVIQESVPYEWKLGDFINSNMKTNFHYYFSGYTEDEFKLSTPYGIDTSNGTNFSHMFKNSKIIAIPKLDLRKATNAQFIFFGCDNLETIEKIKCDSLKSSILGSGAFNGCSKLTNITFDGTIEIDSNDFNISSCKNLTIDSAVNILESLKDNTNKTTQFFITFPTTLSTLLTDAQKNIAINKNIQIKYS